MKTSDALKSLRGKKLKTQQETADLLNVSRQTYNGYEADIYSLDLDTILKVLKALDANNQEVDEFFNALKQDAMS